VLLLVMNLVFVVVCVVLMAGAGVHVAKATLPHVMGSLRERSAAIATSFIGSRRARSNGEADMGPRPPAAPAEGAGLLSAERAASTGTSAALAATAPAAASK
jgi:hypothetical protein